MKREKHHPGFVTWRFTYSFSEAKHEDPPTYKPGSSSSKAYQHLYSWGVSKPADHSWRCVTSVGASARVREGRTRAFLFLSDQFRSPRLTIVKLTLKTTVMGISLWLFHLRSSHGIAVWWVASYLDLDFSVTETHDLTGPKLVVRKS